MARRQTLWCHPIPEETMRTRIWRAAVVVAMVTRVICSQPKVPGLDTLNEIPNWYALICSFLKMLACIQADFLGHLERA